MDVQQGLIYLIGAAAAVFLLWKFAALMRGGSGGSCPGCGSCGRPRKSGRRFLFKGKP
jgi:hypothetical protein